LGGVSVTRQCHLSFAFDGASGQNPPPTLSPGGRNKQETGAEEVRKKGILPKAKTCVQGQKRAVQHVSRCNYRRGDVGRGTET